LTSIVLTPSGIGHFGAAKAGSEEKLTRAISISIIVKIFIDFFVTIIISPFLVLKISRFLKERTKFKKGRGKGPQRETQNSLGAFILAFSRSFFP